MATSNSKDNQGKAQEFKSWQERGPVLKLTDLSSVESRGLKDMRLIIILEASLNVTNDAIRRIMSATDLKQDR